MQKVTFIKVGKSTPQFIRDGEEHFFTMLKKYCSLEVVTLSEGDYTSSQKVTSEKKKETERLIKALPKDAQVIYLDVMGKHMDTPQFAKYLETSQEQGLKLCFVIGGAYGVSEEFFSYVQTRLSLSSMTTSHQLVRLFFLEQLYRGYSVVKGSGYHHS